MKKLRFRVYSNLYNGAGLQKDWELLYKILTMAGHEVYGVDIKKWVGHPHPPGDINIFLEIIEPAMLAPNVARENWLIPNSEWWPGPGYQQPDNWNNYLHRFDKILCKTKDCYDIWSRKVPREKCIYTGWEARDMRSASPVIRHQMFLHLAGKSETKNTAAVTEAWKRFALPHKLTVSAFKPEIVSLCRGVTNVRHVERFSDEEVIFEMNRHIFHVMPSKYEGYGHAIHEALSCGGIVITTDAPPMNQFNGVASELLIPVSRREPRGPAVFNIVDSYAVAAKVKQAANLGQQRIAELSRQARCGFEQEREHFRQTIGGIIFHAASI